MRASERLARGAARLAEGRWNEALAELADAGSSPFVRAQRAVALDRLGRFDEAVREWGLVARAMPGSPEPDMAAAQVLQDQAQYGRALRKLDRAVAAFPGRAEPLARRARLYSIQGRFDEAARDIEGALKAEPGQLPLELEEAKLAILRGRAKEAGRLLESLERRHPGEPELAWLRGVADCRSRRFDEAVRRFDEFTRRSRPLGEAAMRRASFYANAARVLASAPLGGTSARELRLCGLGYRHPYQTSVEVILALASCRTIYSNHSDPAVAEFLTLFPAEPRVVVFRKWRTQAASCARQVFEGVGEGGTVGFVTRGHPLFFGTLAEKMVLRARRSGLPCKVYGSVNIAETFLGLAADPGRGAPGVHVLDGRSMVEGRPPELPWGKVPAVIYNIGEPSQRRRLADVVSKRFPEGRACYLLAGSGAGEYEPRRGDVGGLARELESADPAVTLYIPAEGS
jgi:tetratricopeptide (TPR) repeat protein